MPTTTPSEPAVLLLRAVDNLPTADREAVLAWLLTRLGAAASPTSHQSWLLGSAGMSDRALRTVLEEAPSTRGEQQMVPVRFPVEQHTRLRAWCQEHGFPMASVIRGLVARFLDSQAPVADSTAAPGTASSAPAS